MRGYQVDGYQWLGSLEHLGLGGILADDMGLGKTPLQMIAHISKRVWRQGTPSPRSWYARPHSCTTGLPSWSALRPRSILLRIVGAKGATSRTDCRRGRA